MQDFSVKLKNSNDIYDISKFFRCPLDYSCIRICFDSCTLRIGFVRSFRSEMPKSVLFNDYDLISHQNYDKMEFGIYDFGGSEMIENLDIDELQDVYFTGKILGANMKISFECICANKQLNVCARARPSDNIIGQLSSYFYKPEKVWDVNFNDILKITEISGHEHMIYLENDKVVITNQDHCHDIKYRVCNMQDNSVIQKTKFEAVECKTITFKNIFKTFGIMDENMHGKIYYDDKTAKILLKTDRYMAMLNGKPHNNTLSLSSDDVVLKFSVKKDILCDTFGYLARISRDDYVELKYDSDNIYFISSEIYCELVLKYHKNVIIHHIMMISKYKNIVIGCPY